MKLTEEQKQKICDLIEKSLNSARLKNHKTDDDDNLQHEKPEIRKAEKMTFMFEPYKKGISKVACRQCSGCHGCR